MNSDAFPERLRAVIGDRSLRSFGAACGLSEGALRKYLSGRSEPGMSALISMAYEGGVCVGWLATGEGPKSAEEETDVSQLPLDKQVLWEVIVQVEKVFAYVKKAWPPEDKAKLILLLHDEIVEGEMKSEEIEKNVLRLVKLAS